MVLFYELNITSYKYKNLLNSMYGTHQSFSRSLKKIYLKHKYPLYNFNTIKCAIVIHNCGGKNPESLQKEAKIPIEVNYMEKNESIRDCDLVVIGL